MARDAVVVVDESDLAIDQYCIVYDEKCKSINGMINTLLSKKVFLLSASYSKYDEEFFKHVFKMQPGSLHVFRSQFELHSPKSTDPDKLIDRALATS